MPEITLLTAVVILGLSLTYALTFTYGLDWLDRRRDRKSRLAREAAGRG